MKPKILFMLFTLCALLPDISLGEESETPERDVEIMELIIKDFCQIKKLCDGKKHGKFVIHKLNEIETAKILAETVNKAVSTCAEVFELRLSLQESESIYLYCYDGKNVKLIIEKENAKL